MFHPDAGITASISDPIITGKNITLNAKSLGKELAPVTYSDLTNLKTLKKLAGAKGGDVTFDGNGGIILQEQSPLTVKQLDAKDKLNITTQGNTFISGTANTKFNVNTPINARNSKVVLMTGNGIDASKGITAKDVELYAGAGNITAKIISGQLTANALGDITINADNNLTVNNVTSGSNAILNANGSVISADEYFVVKAPNVNITATDNIGTKLLPLVILADDTALKARYAYIMGDYENLNVAPGTEIIMGSNGEDNALGGEDNASGGDENIYNNSSKRKSSSRDNSNYQSNYYSNDNNNNVATKDAPTFDNVAEPADTVSSNNAATTAPTIGLTDTFSYIVGKYGLLKEKTASLLDKFTYTLNKYFFSKTPSLDTEKNPATTKTNMAEWENTVSEDNADTNLTLTRLSDNSLRIVTKDSSRDK